MRQTHQIFDVGTCLSIGCLPVLYLVYAKTPLGDPAQVLEYLSRVTHRTAIGNERIRAISQGEVVFSVRADDQGGKRRVRLIVAEFIRWFLLHVLPSGIMRIRHYGVLASESAQAFMQRVALDDGARVETAHIDAANGRLGIAPEISTAYPTCPRSDRHAAAP